ncbi:uncharacterized protein [Dysidea avara]|uniref:uncharacterized protein n=1 Tax=Dysidea avara TaxID=196820 RepID=UPI003329C720
MKKSQTQIPNEQDLKSNVIKYTNLQSVLPKPYNSSSTIPYRTPPIPESTSTQTTSLDTTKLYDDTVPRCVAAQKPEVEEKTLPGEIPDYAESETVVTTPASTALFIAPTGSNRCEITSKPYDLEQSAAEFPLPQIIRVYSGYYGITEQFSMSEGEKLILFFIKFSNFIMVTTRSKAETYHLPLNTSLQFSPYKTSENESQTYRYKTIGDLIQREEGLPKVVRVFRSFSGVSEESSVSAGDLIFPRKVSGKKKKMVLKCINKSRKKLKLDRNCVGDFSTDPSDVRMHLLEYVEYINEFPYTAMVFNDNDESSKLSCLRTGTVLILEAAQPLHSYICSTGIFGEKDYPILELPMIMPIQIQCMELSGLNMEPIYNKVQHAYENFKPSMIKKSLYPAQNQKELKAQQQFYEEALKDDGSSHLYDLERPEAIYEPIPVENPLYVRKVEKVQLPPSLPPMNPSCVPFAASGATVTSPLVSAVNSLTSPTQWPLPEHASNKLPPSVLTSPLAKSGSLPPVIPSSPIPLGNKQPTYEMLEDPTQPMVPATTSTTLTVATTPEENIAYLKTMDAETVLQLLGDMNLAEYKDSFQLEQVDGELLVDLTKNELEDLGVTKKIHQLRLMKLINGSSSAKKYKGGIYGTLS